MVSSFQVNTSQNLELSKLNPEDLLIASLSNCHRLWYLHFCKIYHVTVEEYFDKASGTLLENNNARGVFKEVTLSPIVIVQSKNMINLAQTLHIKASEYSFITNSMNFPVKCNPIVLPRF